MCKRIHQITCFCLFFFLLSSTYAQEIIRLQSTGKKVQLESSVSKSSFSRVRDGRPEKCGFNLVMNQAIAKGFNNDEFEAQLKRIMKNSPTSRSSSTIYTIPIIFHIVHRGEAVGTFPNLSAAQVAAQITQLNNDFANLSGSSYGVSADVRLRFCAAVVDPSGKPLAEPGIERINGASRSWPNTSSMSQNQVFNTFNATIKPQSIWDPYSYVNVWTADMASSGLLGYATFPGLSTLSGLENTENDQTAGVVIEAASTGSVSSPGTGTPYNLGRTLTHELGHFFGLRHIWGDAQCGNDYCTDTPPQDDATSGCPLSPAPNNCLPSGPKMFENYMDYSNDACMNTFTTDQVARVQTVMINSPRRKELLNSKACQSRPGNAIQFTRAHMQETETGSTGTCPVTRTINASVAVSVQSTGTATLTFVTNGTAANGADFTVSPASVSFTNGDNTSKNITITIIDDKAIESTETIELSYTISGSGVQSGPDKQVLTINIIDNDLERKISNSAVSLLNENFNASTSAPAGWTLMNGSGNGWVISANGGSGTTGNALHISENSTTKPNTYNKLVESEAMAITPLLDATGLTNINATFKWRGDGEAGFDEGYLGYILESDPSSVYLFNTVFSGQAGTAQTFSGNLPLSFNNSKFYLVFYWYNDDLIGSDPPFTVDDVVITGQALSIESTLNDAVTAPQYTGQTVQYVTADNQIITRIANLNQNVGCITATVQSAGTGRTSIQTQGGTFFRTNKVIRITPAVANTTATYQATFYFSAAELSTAWSPAEIPQLKILKVKDGVNLSNVLTGADAQVVPATFDDKTSDGGYYSYTGSFTDGFSQFMLVSPSFTLPVNLITFEAQPARKSIELSWKTASERNNKGFHIERSTNGTEFSAIGWVDGVGTTSDASSYVFTDHFVQPNTVYYYRLKQVDFDSRSTFSEIRKAKITGDALVVTVSPNPAKDQIKVFVAGSSQPADISLVNAKGQTVGRWSKANVGSPYSINVERFAKGYYTLIIHLKEGEVTEQVIIQ